MLARGRIPIRDGLAYVTIRAPHCRLDLALPRLVPLIDLLPELVHRAGGLDPGYGPMPLGGWCLRRGDGTTLHSEATLGHQGVRDGDVLYLVPDQIDWPEPSYDDVIEEIAEAASTTSRGWDSRATRTVALVVVGALLATVLGLALTAVVRPANQAGSAGLLVLGLGTVGLAMLLLTAGGLLSRAGADGPAGMLLAAWAVGYAGVGSASLLTGAAAASGPDRLLVGASAGLLTAVAAGLAVGCGLRVFVAGVTVCACGVLVALLASVVTTVAAAAILVLVAVAGTGFAAPVAIRLGRLPVPPGAGSVASVAAERRAEPGEVRAAVQRADGVFTGVLLGAAAAAVAASAVLATAQQFSARTVAALAGITLLLRSRLFPSRAARLPLLVGGLLCLALPAATWLVAAGPALRVLAAAGALVVVAALVAVASTASSRRAEASPYLGRLADVTEIITIVVLLPTAAVQIGLYGWMRDFVG